MADHIHPTIHRVTSNVKASYWLADPENELPLKLIDSKLFTHLFCAFADIDSSTYTVVVSSENKCKFSDFTGTVQDKNEDVQTLLSIGGEKADKTVLAAMASTTENRKAFIDSSIDLARNYGFYGLDLAWQYPSNGVEMTHFGKLLEEWRVAIKKESDSTNKLPLLLTAAVYYSPHYYSETYPVQMIADNLDFVNIMSYDFYGPGWSAVTGPPAALFDPSSNADTANLNGDFGLGKWLEANLPAKKIVLGFSYCGWAWTLEDAEDNGYDAATDGAAITPDGSITYDKIRDYIVNNGAATYYDPAVIGHYCYVGSTWIGYDDNQSIVAKVRYAKEKGLFGYYSWHVGADYNCGLSRAASLAWNTEVTTAHKDVTGE